ncbi:hypothetical protein ACQPYA_12955 [Micromonospora sp. CA-263727]|uniref:hypothetical protein n=1 Tax=Micromonospora sp. CA-263727 TaxID=3239967 RepID=UPI003D917A73
MLLEDGIAGVGRGVSNELSGTVIGPAVMAGQINDLHVHLASRVWVPPHQLPPLGVTVVNRSDELAEIERAVSAANGPNAPVVVLCGPGGVGKTALALRWLHANRARFPDGELRLDLGGGAGAFLPPGEALGTLLRALGVAAEVIPPSADERAGLYQSLIFKRRVVVFLENAATAAQVRLLLPAGPEAAVIVTSRSRLSGLGVVASPVLIEVAPLREDAAIDLLRSRIGAVRLDQEIVAARQLAVLCGRYPLALSITGARLAGRTKTTIATAVRDLVQGRHRLVSMAAVGDDRSMASALDPSYASLPPQVAVFCRAVGLHPTPEFSLAAAAAAGGVTEDEAEASLVVLTEDGLLTEVEYRRYRFHDVLWLDAAARAAKDPYPVRAAVLRRLVQWYLRQAAMADLIVKPDRWRVGEIFEELRGSPTSYADRKEALAWLELERANLVAAVLIVDEPFGDSDRRAVDELVCQLCVALWGLFFAIRDYEGWIATHTAGIAAARRLGDGLALAKLYCQRGFAYLGRGDTEAARADFTEGLHEAESVGDPQAKSTAVESLGLAALQEKRFTDALACFDRALEIARSARLARLAVALLVHHRGRALSGLDRHGEALAVFDTALAEMRAVGDRYNEGRVLTSRGLTHSRVHRLDEAAESLDAAITIMREESLFQTAEVAVALADVAEQRGAVEREREFLDEALTAYVRLGAPKAAAVAERLTRLSSAVEPAE